MFHISNPSLKQTEKTNRGRALFKLQEPLEVIMMIGSGKLEIKIPAGYETDFASTPWFLQWFIPSAGRYSRAAIVHDWFYSNPHNCTRFFADCLFREIMCHLEVPMWKRVLMYYGVRFGGAFLWKGDK